MRLGLNGTGPAGCQAKSLDPPGGTPRGVVLIIALCRYRSDLKGSSAGVQTV